MTLRTKKHHELQTIIDSIPDISMRKQMEEALQENEYRFRQIVERTPFVGLHEYRLQKGDLVFGGYNQAANTILHLDHTPFIGKSIGTVFPALTMDLLDHYRKIAQQDGLTWRSEVHYADQQIEGWYDIFAFHCCEQGIAVTFTDISAQKHLVQQLEDAKRHRYQFGALIGKSSVMQDVYQRIEKAARIDSSVLLTGESGTGKDVVAQMIHSLSQRKHFPFVAINCGAIPHNLMESTFFGHKKGAFTGADQDRPGYFDRAHQGTLFLNEIGELSSSLQAKFLRVIENGKYSQVGDTKDKYADVRIIAATHQNPHQVLRQDLYYRVNVIPIHLPPLREHKEDIPLLIDHFRQDTEIPRQVSMQLYQYNWPGNVRELSQIVQRYCTIGILFDISDVSFGDVQGLQKALNEFEHQYITRVLQRSSTHRDAAKRLKISTRNLRQKCQKYHLS